MVTPIQQRSEIASAVQDALDVNPLIILDKEDDVGARTSKSEFEVSPVWRA